MFSEFKTQYKDKVLIGDTTTSDPSLIKVFFIHGAGKSSIEKFKPLRELMLSKGIHSCGFDFVGHGKTGGELLGHSLKDRVEQSQTFLSAIGVIPKVLVGTSMGGYIAVKLLELYPIQTVIMGAPGMFSKEAYDVPFGDEFSKILRKPASWKESDAWDILAKFKGSLSIYWGEKDEVVSPDIVKMIYDSAVHAEKRKVTVIPGVGHMLWSYFAEHPEYLEKIAEDSIQ